MHVGYTSGREEVGFSIQTNWYSKKIDGETGHWRKAEIGFDDRVYRSVRVLAIVIKVMRSPQEENRFVRPGI